MTITELPINYLMYNYNYDKLHADISFANHKSFFFLIQQIYPNITHYSLIVVVIIDINFHIMYHISKWPMSRYDYYLFVILSTD